MTLNTHKFKNAMHMYAAELKCTAGGLGFQTLKPVLCRYNKLNLDAEILNLWVNDVIFSRSNLLGRVVRKVVNVNPGLNVNWALFVCVKNVFSL